MRLEHTFPPIYDEASEILILGSFPSVVSRAEGFYYGHPRNRFWKLLAAIYGETPPVDVESKKKLLKLHRLALWDVCSSCEIIGSADSSIKSVVPNDLSIILNNAKIRQIITNGKTADALFRKYCQDSCTLSSICLPSTSPANAASSFEDLLSAWKIILL